MLTTQSWTDKIKWLVMFSTSRNEMLLLHLPCCLFLSYYCCVRLCNFIDWSLCKSWESLGNMIMCNKHEIFYMQIENGCSNWNGAKWKRFFLLPPPHFSVYRFVCNETWCFFKQTKINSHCQLQTIHIKMCISLLNNWMYNPMQSIQMIWLAFYAHRKT